MLFNIFNYCFISSSSSSFVKLRKGGCESTAYLSVSLQQVQPAVAEQTLPRLPNHTATSSSLSFCHPASPSSLHFETWVELVSARDCTETKTQLVPTYHVRHLGRLLTSPTLHISRREELESGRPTCWSSSGWMVTQDALKQTACLGGLGTIVHCTNPSNKAI